MKRLAGLIAAMLIALAAPAFAQVGAVGNGGPPSVYPLQTYPSACNYRALSGTGTTVISTTPGAIFCGMQSFGAQLGVTTCYDSTNGTGQIIGGGISLGLAGTSGPGFNLGIVTVNGISCTQTISLLGGGILVFFR